MEEREKAPMHEWPHLEDLTAREGPPMHEWPGQPLGLGIKMAYEADSALDRYLGPRERFDPRQRFRAVMRAWSGFADMQAYAFKLLQHPRHHRVTLITGEDAAGAGFLAAHLADTDFRHGYPVFSTMPLLVGWHVTEDELVAAVRSGAIRDATIILDGVRSPSRANVVHEQLLTARKRNIHIVGVETQDFALSPAVRLEVGEVWAVQQYEMGREEGQCRIAYRAYRDYPYRTQRPDLHSGLPDTPNYTDRYLGSEVAWHAGMFIKWQ